MDPYCNAPRCHRPIHSTGRCVEHYQPARCAEPDCHAKVYARSWCGAHDTEHRRRFDPATDDRVAELAAIAADGDLDERCARILAACRDRWWSP